MEQAQSSVQTKISGLFKELAYYLVKTLPHNKDDSIISGMDS